MCASGLKSHCIQNMVFENFLEMSPPVVSVFAQWLNKKLINDSKKYFEDHLGV